ncbi:MAG TPA: arginine--tRNA ligase, partial [Bacteroidota bacterium]|nr:arginine--tRNA ligase [Bacteroidota bacterium]
MKEYLRAELTSALRTLSYPEVDLIFDKPKVAAHGDLTTNVAMMLAKQVGKNPRQVAQTILDTLKLDASRIASIEIAGPGFINFRFADTAVFETAKRILREGSAFGRSDFGKRRKTNIEWVSANPTGPLHAGHGRQVILGAAMANILDWTGYDVTREYYFNNAGNQMRNLAESVYARYRQELGDDYPMPEKGYMGDYIRDIA